MLSYYLIVSGLLMFSGLFSGLTLSLMSLNKLRLARKAELGDKKAVKIYEIRKRGNLLLCTLIIGNIAVNSALSIYLGSLTNGFLAGLIATILIVIFGEILPQAVFSRYALKIGYFFYPFVKLLIITLYPLSAPIAWLLDKLLGEEMPDIYEKREIEKLVEFQKSHPSSPIDADEARIIKGALNFSDKTVEDIMTPENVVFMLESNQSVDKELIKLVKERAFSRIPVFTKEKNNIIGLLYTRDLLGVDLEKDLKVKDFIKKEILSLEIDEKLDQVLHKFIKSHVHLGIVFNEFKNFEGVVSLEDVLEEIIRKEIVDEYDKVADLRKKAREKVSKSLS